jgi:type I restriction enzyme M protein
MAVTEEGAESRGALTVLTARDKCSLDVFWLKDESLEASENLPAPDVIARDIVEDIRAALEQFEAVALDLGEERA